MEDIRKFIVENWQIIGAAFLCFLSFIINLFRKKPAVNSLQQWCQFIVANQLPGFINKAELSGLSGDEKKNKVLRMCLDALGHLILLDQYSKKEAYDYFDLSIESVLSTPEKKV